MSITIGMGQNVPSSFIKPLPKVLVPEFRRYP